MTMENDDGVLQRIFVIVQKAALARGSKYDMDACKAAIHALHQENAISADYRDLLLKEIGDMQIPWESSIVETIETEGVEKAFADQLTPKGVADLSFVLMQAVDRNLATVNDALRVLAKIRLALRGVPPSPSASPQSKKRTP